MLRSLARGLVAVRHAIEEALIDMGATNADSQSPASRIGAAL